MRHIRSLCGWLACVCASGVATAQPLEETDLALAYGDRSFVSIATGSRQLVSKAPSVTTVITAEDIASMGARTLSEVLEAVPGLHVSRNTLENNYAPTYGMRGILTDSAPHVLTMVNGVARTSVFLGNPDEQRVELPVENIARIEVIRGPGSAVYGADAFAGTINIITKTAADIDGTSVAVRAGSFKTREGWVQHGSRHGELEVAGYLKLGTSDGPHRTIRADAQSALDAALGTRASLAPGPVNTGHDSVDGQLDVAYGRLRLRAGYTLRDDLGTGAGIGAALDPVGRVRSERISGDVTWSDAQFARDLAVTLQAAYMKLDNDVTRALRVFPPGASFAALGGSAFPDGVLGTPDKSERQMRLSAGAVYTGVADHRLRFGVGHDEMEIYKTSDTKNFSLLPGVPTLLPTGMTAVSGAELFLMPHERRVDYAYLQDEWSFARAWTLTAGVRHDHYSDFGSTTNPRLALVWEARADLTARLMYGTAFRAPSFVEQYAGSNPVAMGNPNLDPERISTVDASLTWQAAPGLQSTLSLFRHRIRDIIALSGTTYQNAGRQTGRGGELEISWDAAAALRVTGHYAYQRNEDETTGRDAGYAPHHHLYARADWGFAPGWHLSGQVNRIAGRQRVAGDARPEVPDYTSVDVSLRTDRNRAGWDFSASIYNLFDADIREPSKAASGIVDDLPMAPRSFWLQARYSL